MASTADKAEFAKDLSAIANSDSAALDDYGYIVIGARRGEFVNGPSPWGESTSDHFSASLTDVAKEYLVPVPSFHFLDFVDPKTGRPFGLIVIPPSGAQPHVCIREVSGNPAKHDWFVRLNDTTSRASAWDYARILSKAINRETRPLQRQLQELAASLKVLEQNSGHGVAAMVRGVVEPATPERIGQPGQNPADQIRSILDSPEQRVEDVLVAQALHLIRIMTEESECNPWNLGLGRVAALRTIEYLEEAARPFAESAATLVRYDLKGRMTPGLVRAFQIVAEEPDPPGGIYVEIAPYFRLYPLAISIMAVLMVAVRERRADVLKALFSVSLRRKRQHLSAPRPPLPEACRDVRNASQYFQLAFEQQRLIDPVAERLWTVLPRLVGDLIPGPAPGEVYCQAEFILALTLSMPMSGRYQYAPEATTAITELLRSGTWLNEVFPDLEGRLEQYDKTAEEFLVRTNLSRRGGFISGALDAWKNRVQGQGGCL